MTLCQNFKCKAKFVSGAASSASVKCCQKGLSLVLYSRKEGSLFFHTETCESKGLPRSHKSSFHNGWKIKCHMSSPALPVCAHPWLFPCSLSTTGLANWGDVAEPSARLGQTGLSAPRTQRSWFSPQASASHSPAAATSSGSAASLLKGQHRSQQGRSLHPRLSACEWDALTTDGWETCSAITFPAKRHLVCHCARGVLLKAVNLKLRIKEQWQTIEPDKW